MQQSAFRNIKVADSKQRPKEAYKAPDIDSRKSEHCSKCTITRYQPAGNISSIMQNRS